MPLENILSCWKYLYEWSEHEIALGDEWMGNLEVGLVDRPVIVEQDVDVDWTIVIDTANRFLFSAQHPFNLLGLS